MWQRPPGKRPFLCIAYLLLSFAALVAPAIDYRNLEGVKRSDQDLYPSANPHFQISFCCHCTYGEDAALTLGGGHGGRRGKVESLKPPMHADTRGHAWVPSASIDGFRLGG